MTLLQIRYAVCAASCLSINKAAALLFTTPSNVSKSVKALEDELGYLIFHRSNNGLVVTATGAKFIQYATAVLEDCDKMTALGSDTAGHSFSVCYNQLPLVQRAFADFCSYPQATAFKLRLHQGNFWFCIDQLKKSRCQIAFLSFYSAGETAYLKEIEDAGLEMTFLADANAALVLREGHPLLENADLDSVSFEGLTEYPYVNFTMPGYEQEILTPYQIGGDVWLVNPSRVIDINNASQKLPLIQKTNAYTFISTRLKHTATVDGCVVIPNTAMKFRYYYVHRKKEAPDSNEKLFLRCFQKELHNPDSVIDL